MSYDEINEVFIAVQRDIKIHIRILGNSVGVGVSIRHISRRVMNLVFSSLLGRGIDCGR